MSPLRLLDRYAHWTLRIKPDWLGFCAYATPFLTLLVAINVAGFSARPALSDDALVRIAERGRDAARIASDVYFELAGAR